MQALQGSEGRKKLGNPANAVRSAPTNNSLTTSGNHLRGVNKRATAEHGEGDNEAGTDRILTTHASLRPPGLVDLMRAKERVAYDRQELAARVQLSVQVVRRSRPGDISATVSRKPSFPAT